MKEAEARLPAALMTAYRLVLVPARNKTLRGFDLGIAGYSGRTTLSSRVSEKLLDEQQLLDKLDPGILIGERFGLWPNDQEVINVRTLADYFTQLTHLPRLNSAHVLPDCLAKGVQRGLFAYALGDGEQRAFDTIVFNDKTVSANDCEITETAWLVRPAVAKTLMPEPETVPSCDLLPRYYYRPWRSRYPGKHGRVRHQGIAEPTGDRRGYSDRVNPEHPTPNHWYVV